MCGIFGFIGEQPDINILRDCAIEANRRGPHAHGVSWLEGKAYSVKTAAGDIEDNLGILTGTQQSRIIVGNCRLATSGSWKNPINNQPLSDGSLVVSHNGNVYNFADIYQSTGYQPKTKNDSEAILAMLSRMQGNFRRRCLSAVIAVESTSPIAVIMASDNELIAYRRGHPLYHLTTDLGVYFCSRKVTDDFVMLGESELHLWKTIGSIDEVVFA